MTVRSAKPRLIGINHVALEVGSIDEALAFYGALFEFHLRGRAPGMAFIDMGDQFLALSEGRSQAPVRELAVAAGARIVDGKGLEILDPWGNRLEIVEYRQIQFTKTRAILDHLGVFGEKTSEAEAELKEKGLVADARLPDAHRQA